MFKTDPDSHIKLHSHITGIQSLINGRTMATRINPVDKPVRSLPSKDSCGKPGSSSMNRKQKTWQRPRPEIQDLEMILEGFGQLVI